MQHLFYKEVIHYSLLQDLQLHFIQIHKRSSWQSQLPSSCDWRKGVPPFQIDKGNLKKVFRTVPYLILHSHKTISVALSKNHICSILFGYTQNIIVLAIIVLNLVLCRTAQSKCIILINDWNFKLHNIYNLSCVVSITSISIVSYYTSWHAVKYIKMNRNNIYYIFSFYPYNTMSKIYHSMWNES